MTGRRAALAASARPGLRRHARGSESLVAQRSASADPAVRRDASAGLVVRGSVRADLVDPGTAALTERQCYILD